MRHCLASACQSPSLSSSLTFVHTQRLEDDGLSSKLARAIAQGDTEYSVSSLGIPGLRHFVYKSRAHLQITMPTFEDPYDDPNEKRRYGPPSAPRSERIHDDDFFLDRLITLYQTLFDAIHARSGQERTLKLQYIKTSQESVMGWVGIWTALCPRPLLMSASPCRSLSRSSCTSRSPLAYPRAPP